MRCTTSTRVSAAHIFNLTVSVSSILFCTYTPFVLTSTSPYLRALSSPICESTKNLSSNPLHSHCIDLAPDPEYAPSPLSERLRVYTQNRCTKPVARHFRNTSKMKININQLINVFEAKQKSFSAPPLSDNPTERIFGKSFNRTSTHDENDDNDPEDDSGKENYDHNADNNSSSATITANWSNTLNHIDSHLGRFFGIHTDLDHLRDIIPPSCSTFMQESDRICGTIKQISSFEDTLSPITNGFFNYDTNPQLSQSETLTTPNELDFQKLFSNSFSSAYENKIAVLTADRDINLLFRELFPTEDEQRTALENADSDFKRLFGADLASAFSNHDAMLRIFETQCLPNRSQAVNNILTSSNPSGLVKLLS